MAKEIVESVPICDPPSSTLTGLPYAEGIYEGRRLSDETIQEWKIEFLTITEDNPTVES